ncbi:MAG: hypothetical protein ACXABY_01630 [Candidatus Thorarchaeota archaeon]|jgi:hypothetical protein
MKRILITLAVLLVGGWCFNGCSYSPTGDENTTVNVNHDQSGASDDDGGANGKVSNSVSGFSCVRIMNNNGHASNCELNWFGDVTPKDVVAVRISDNAVSPHPAKSPGTVIDPGPGGSGGGTWNIHCFPLGAASGLDLSNPSAFISSALASTSVVLDS